MRFLARQWPTEHGAGDRLWPRELAAESQPARRGKTQQVVEIENSFAPTTSRCRRPVRRQDRPGFCPKPPADPSRDGPTCQRDQPARASRHLP